MRALLVAVTMGLLLTGPAAAVLPDEKLADPALEARARDLSAELRCVVCQNESIDSSNAPVARDLRLLVRERLAAGDSDAEVLAFIQARYGDYVLLNPPWKPTTWLLWLSPFAVLCLGGVLAVAVMRGRRPADSPPLSPAERAELDRLTRDVS